jgi:hypothetical protein
MHTEPHAATPPPRQWVAMTKQEAPSCRDATHVTDGEGRRGGGKGGRTRDAAAEEAPDDGVLAAAQAEHVDDAVDARQLHTRARTRGQVARAGPGGRSNGG